MAYVHKELPVLDIMTVSNHNGCITHFMFKYFQILIIVEIILIDSIKFYFTIRM